jgi:hypothetical protein
LKEFPCQRASVCQVQVFGSEAITHFFHRYEIGDFVDATADDEPRQKLRCRNTHAFTWYPKVVNARTTCFNILDGWNKNCPRLSWAHCTGCETKTLL